MEIGLLPNGFHFLNGFQPLQKKYCDTLRIFLGETGIGKYATKNKGKYTQT